MLYRNVGECEQLLQGDPRLLQAQLIDYIIFLREEKKVVADTKNNGVSKSSTIQTMLN